MPTYLWSARNKRNEKRKGELDAKDENAARMAVQRMQLTSIKIKPKPKDILENVAFLQPGIKTKDIIIFSRQFSTMIDAGLPIIGCLDILYRQQENKTFQKKIKDIKDHVESGGSLADGFKRHPGQFDDLFVNMVAAGEVGGILDTIMRRLSEYMEKAAKLKAQIKGAMVYPVATIVIAIGVVAVLLIFVIPVFEEMFAGMGEALPMPTQIVVNISNIAKNSWYWIALGLFLFFYAFRYFYKTDKGKIVVDSTLLRLPAFGALLRKAAVSKFTRTMGTMLASGVSILEALDIVAKTAGNKAIENAVYDVREAIAEGRTMAEPLSQTGVFPPMVCQMVAVGESTGALDAMMLKIADFYDEEVDQAVENITALIEPFMLVFLGVVIGGMVVAMYLPIFTMAGGLTD